MPRPRSCQLKVGDKITHNNKEGVVVSVDHSQKKPYGVHFHPTGRGIFAFGDLKKAKPHFKLAEMVDQEDVITEDRSDAQG